MNEYDEIEAILRKTFEDRVLSKSESQAIGQVFKELGSSEEKLRFIRNRVFDIAEPHLEGNNNFKIFDWMKGVLKTVDKSRPSEAAFNNKAFFSPGDACRDELIRLISKSYKSIDICVFTITDDRIKKAILKAHGRKLAIRIITDNEKAYDLGSDVLELEKKGIPVKIDDTSNHMHHKFALFDAKHLLTGSFNWTVSATRYNCENIIVTDDIKMIQQFSFEFEKLWKVFPDLNG